MNILNDEYGKYRVGKKVFFNKYEAIEACIGTYNRITFHYQDEFWSNVDWITEPTDSLSKLYEQRVKQLREYDYIILCYSGGADSWNILNTFDRTNTPLDEIVVMNDLSLSGSRDSYFNAEVWKVAIPEAKLFIEKHPGTKLNIIDVGPSLLQVLPGISTEDQLTHHFQGVTTIGSSIRSGHWIYTEDRYKKLIEQGKRVCLLWGLDKTILKQMDGRYCFWFNDFLLQYKRKALYRIDLPVYDEFFYWSKDLPELVIKQCHIQKKGLQNLSPFYIDPFPIPTRSRHELSVRNKNNQRISIQTLNSWLYPGWDVNTYSVGKPGGTTFAGQHDEWLTGKENEDIVKIWLATTKRAVELFKNLTPENKDKTNTYAETGKNHSIFMTKPYWVENFVL